MRPLILKAPTKCCQATELTRPKGKEHFLCACGQFKTDLFGRPFKNKRISVLFGKNGQAALLKRKHIESVL